MAFDFIREVYKWHEINFHKIDFFYKINNLFYKIFFIWQKNAT